MGSKARFVRACARRPAGCKRANPRIIEYQSRKVDVSAKDLTVQQQLVMREIIEGKSVFFTGPAGTGKSHLLQQIISMLPSEGTYITASTGRAAVQIGGTTLHSFAGIGMGLDNGSILHDILRRARRPQAAHRWRSARVLIIDEISMIDADTFDALELIAREIRGNTLPFGGIQLILTGDFLQLPPVGYEKQTIVGDVGSPHSTEEAEAAARARLSLTREPSSLYEPKRRQIRYAFEASSWQRCVPLVMQLTDTLRHTKDPVLSRVLEEIRYGVASDWVCRTLSSKVDDDTKTQSVNGTRDSTAVAIEPTRLYATREMVDSVNEHHINKLEGAAFKFDAIDFGPNQTQQSNTTTTTITGSENTGSNETTFTVPKTLNLKIGAQVVLVRNLDPENGLVNGSRGVVVGFRPFGDGDLKNSSRNGKSRKQKQGKTDRKLWKKLSHEQVMPVIEFCNGRSIVIEPLEWTIQHVTDKGSYISRKTRHQLPLILGWALTIHRCQGMTIDRAEISLKGAFEYGQAYVALSRVRCLNDLKLLDFDPGTMRADNNAIRFHLELEQEPEGTAVREMPQVARTVESAPDLIGTFIPKPSPEELRVNNQTELLKKLYTIKGRNKFNKRSIRSMILEYDPLAFAKYWERLAKSDGKRPEFIDEYEHLQEKAGVKIPRYVRRTADVDNFLRSAVNARNAHSAVPRQPPSFLQNVMDRFRTFISKIV